MGKTWTPTSTSATASPAGDQFPTSTPQFTTAHYIPSAFAGFTNTQVPGLEPYTLEHPEQEVAPGVVGSHSNVVSGPDARVGYSPSLGQALQQLLEAKPDAVLSLQKRLIKAGYLDPNSGDFVAGQVDDSDHTYAAYAQAMNDAITKDEGFNKLLASRGNDPKNTLGQKFWAAFQAQMKDAGSNGSTTSTETDTSVNYSDPTQAKAAAQTQYESLLGRNLNDQESAAFQQVLHGYEAGNPNQTTTTATSNSAANTNDVSTTSSGGTSDPEQVAQSYIMQHDAPEYAQTQGEQIYQLFANLVG